MVKLIKSIGPIDEMSGRAASCMPDWPLHTRKTGPKPRLPIRISPARGKEADPGILRRRGGIREVAMSRCRKLAGRILQIGWGWLSFQQ